MNNLIHVEQSPCYHCIKCLKICPQEAISIQGGIVHIDESLCIHCDACIQACEHNKLSIKSVDLKETLKEFDYTIACIPTSMLTDMKTYGELKHIAYAIKQLGFDEVAQYSDIEGFLYRKAKQQIGEDKEIHITSLCPSINKLILHEYPTLVDYLLPYEYPEEILAAQLREKHRDKKLGIYHLCPCVAKMELSKHPYGNEDSNIDYAIALSHLFPSINRLRDENTLDIEMCKAGVTYNVSDLFGKKHLNVISVTGLEQIKQVLELIEFGQLKHINLVALYACYQGCVGGNFLWSNPVEGMYNIESMYSELCEDVTELTVNQYHKVRYSTSNNKDLKERIQWFNKVNKILETLPQIDCGSCGYANCRNLAYKIANEEADDSLCLVKKR